MRSRNKSHGGRRVAPAAQAHDGGHARVVPSGDVVVVDQLRQLALAGDDVGEVEAGELVLLGWRCIDEPTRSQTASIASRKTGADLQTPRCKYCA